MCVSTSSNLVGAFTPNNDLTADAVTCEVGIFLLCDSDVYCAFTSEGMDFLFDSFAAEYQN